MREHEYSYPQVYEITKQTAMETRDSFIDEYNQEYQIALFNYMLAWSGNTVDWLPVSNKAFYNHSKQLAFHEGELVRVKDFPEGQRAYHEGKVELLKSLGSFL